MVVSGRVQNGVVVLDNGLSLPEGTAVIVSYPAAPDATSATPKRRVQVPLVRTQNPGTWNLTNEQIGQIFDDEDAGLLS
jgi:hypothetical protein